MHETGDFLLFNAQLFQFFVTQLTPQDLAYVGGRQGIAELDSLGHFIGRDIGAHMLHHLVLGQGGTRLDHDKKLDVLPGLLVRHTNGRALQHARQARQYVFQLVGVHVKPETRIMSFLRSTMRM